MPIEVRRPDAGANDLPDLRSEFDSISDSSLALKQFLPRGAAEPDEPASSIH